MSRWAHLSKVSATMRIDHARTGRRFGSTYSLTKRSRILEAACDAIDASRSYSRLSLTHIPKV
jgi:hypothetical protein